MVTYRMASFCVCFLSTWFLSRWSATHSNSHRLHLNRMSAQQTGSYDYRNLCVKEISVLNEKRYRVPKMYEKFKCSARFWRLISRTRYQNQTGGSVPVSVIWKNSNPYPKKMVYPDPNPNKNRWDRQKLYKNFLKIIWTAYRYHSITIPKS
jgi:hypothetical protein